MPTVSFFDFSGKTDFPEQLFLRTEADLSFFLEKVQPIIDAVKKEGDAAILRYAQQLDHVQDALMAIKAEESEFTAAFARMDAEVVAALKFAADNIKRFHEAQMPSDLWLKEVTPGSFAGDRYTPLDSIACYVPRGKGSFPSMLLMTLIPAVVAGVKHPIVITPPGPDGKVDDATLVAASIVGVKDIYKCGGAVGIAAVAYGTETVPKCIKVVGPGSPWVVAAKRLLAGVIDPGIPAGPSEVVVLADETANGRLCALDLLIESEHGPDSSAFLVTNSRQVAEDALAEIPKLWKNLPPQRAEFSQAVLCGEHGGVVLVDDFAQAIDFTNRYAPEHLEIQAKEPLAVVPKIHNAGEILLGEHTPVTLGNFVLGPNAVLPTGGAARTRGPLSVFDYLKQSSVAYVSAEGYEQLADKAHSFALYEGFAGHAQAVSPLRKDLLKKE